jgi:hypothetical protein
MKGDMRGLPIIHKYIYSFFLSITLLLSYSWVPAIADTTATTRYVSPQGSDSGTCASSTASCRSIQYTVNKSSSGDTILVAAGTYTYNSSADTCTFLPAGGKSVVCIVDKTLTIIGGYTAGNWSTPDPVNNPAIINGNGTYRGVFLLGLNTITTNLRMEGFTIRSCKATGPNTPGDPTGFGGGMIVSGAYITLRDMLFQANTVYGQDTSSGAGGSGAGAGLAINWSQSGTSSLLERVTFDSNQSYGSTGPVRGGLAFGAFYMNGTVTVRDSTFINNTARAGNSSGSGTSGGLLADALGGAIGGGGGSWVLENVTATGNLVQGGNATTYAGGGYGGAIIVENGTNFTLRDSYFANNAAQGGSASEGGFGAGGGVLVNNTLATIERVKIFNNSSMGGSGTGSGKAGAGGGGGLYLWRNSSSASASASVINTIIANNYVALGSSGSTSAGGGGGGIQVQGLYANIKYTTIAYNRLGPHLVSGQGLLLLAAPGVGSASADVGNSIIANHTEGANGASAVLVQSGNTLNFSTGLFAGNTKDTNANGSPVPAGTINGLSSMIQAASAGFVSPNAPDWNYHLASNSPAIDRAQDLGVNLDIDFQTRPFNQLPDIGADEYTGVSVTNFRYSLPLVIR